ncbi:hypothetical protein D3C87_2126120 [compost metagenome]
MDRGIEDTSRRKGSRQVAAAMQQMGKAQFAPEILVIVKARSVEAERESGAAWRNGGDRRHA